MTHDAEDLIHPEELRWINYYAARFDFIQTPVLALRTPFFALTHGVYCDEFAEYHTRDMAVRPLLGGFVPSSGVGTGYRRDALDKLARSAANKIFEPEALTEDYENGLRLFGWDVLRRSSLWCIRSDQENGSPRANFSPKNGPRPCASARVG